MESEKLSEKDLNFALLTLDYLGFAGPGPASFAVLTHPDWRARWDCDRPEFKGAADTVDAWRAAHPQARRAENMERVCPVCALPAARLSGAVDGCPVHGIRKLVAFERGRYARELAP